MKSVLTQRLSLRCKFKSTDTVEVVVVDHDTGDCFVHQLAFRKFNEHEIIVPVDSSNDNAESAEVSKLANSDDVIKTADAEEIGKEAE